MVNAEWHDQDYVHLEWHVVCRGLATPTLEGIVNGKIVRGRRYQMIGNIMINGLYEDTKSKAEKRVEWRMLSLQEKLGLGQSSMID